MNVEEHLKSVLNYLETDATEQELEAVRGAVNSALKAGLRRLEHARMRALSVGQRVEFFGRTEMKRGVITKFNDRSVSVLTEEGETWKVGPTLVRPVEGKEARVN